MNINTARIKIKNVHVNMVKVFGLTGQTGSGKDAVCEYIKEKEDDVTFVRFSTPLTEALSIFLDEIKKEDQQWLGKTVRDKFGNDILAKAIKKRVASIEEGIVILNGIRYPEDNALLKEMGGQLIYVDADSEIRWKRTCKRGEKADDDSTYEAFLKKDQAETELQIKGLMRDADFIITNNGTLQSLHNQIDKILNVQE